MDTKDDSILFLLQDIKELVFAIAVSLLGGILLFASTVDWDTDELFLILSFPVLGYGIFHIWNGWTHHELMEKRDRTAKEGDTHAL